MSLSLTMSIMIHAMILPYKKILLVAYIYRRVCNVQLDHNHSFFVICGSEFMESMYPLELCCDIIL